MKSEIDPEDFQLLKNVELLCREVVMAISYSANLKKLLIDSNERGSDIGNDFWIYCKTSCASSGIIKWCSVFGSKKEKTHWKKLSVLDLTEVEYEMFSNLNVNQVGWEALQNRALTVRDKFIAHNDFRDSAPNIYKQLEPYGTSANILRDEILAHFSNCTSRDQNSNDYLQAVTKIQSDELDLQLSMIFDAGLKNARALISDVDQGSVE